jgi:hypothetical protein
MENKRFAKNPLLYIQQPIITSPEVPMQHNYYTPTYDQKSLEPTNKKKKQPIPLRRNQSTVLTEVEEIVSESEITKELANQKQFKDMSIVQKVKYFIERPDHAPVLRCEIRTDERKIQGVITGLDDNQVLIQIGRRSSDSKIPLEEIKEIRLIGF